MATPNVFQEAQERNKQDVNVAVASVDAPSYTEEKSVPLSVTLAGGLRLAPGTGATDLGKMEDAAHSSGDVGVMLLGIRSGGATTFADTNGDYSPIAVNSTGMVYTTDTRSTDNGVSTASTLRVTVANDSQGSFNPKTSATVISTTSAVALGGSSTANDRRLHALHIYPALTGTCVVAGFNDGTSAQSYTFPAASTGSFNFYGAVNSAGALTVTCSNAADDNKVIAIWSTNS
jgi:hypothetical protein